MPSAEAGEAAKPHLPMLLASSLKGRRRDPVGVRAMEAEESVLGAILSAASYDVALIASSIA